MISGQLREHGCDGVKSKVMSDWRLTELPSDVREKFPYLQQSGFEHTSEPSRYYNCIAWAAGDSERWWWPDPRAYWPSGVQIEETIAAFAEAFSTLGYSICSSPDLEVGVEKIAIYKADDGTPTHAARQLPDGRWTSKLGPWIDIAHNLESICGPEYGSIAIFMKRPLT